MLIITDNIHNAFSPFKKILLCLCGTILLNMLDTYMPNMILHGYDMPSEIQLSSNPTTLPWQR